MAKSAALKFARLSALAFALAVCAWIVVQSHLEANPAGEPASADSPPPSGAAESENTEESHLKPAGGEEPVFLPSSKSTIGIGGGAPGSFKKRKPKPVKKAPVFLPSSKSLPFEGAYEKK